MYPYIYIYILLCTRIMYVLWVLQWLLPRPKCLKPDRGNARRVNNIIIYYI